MPLNHYPWWKNLLIAIIVLIGLIYALPNIFGEQPAIQISSNGKVEITESTVKEVQTVLEQENINFKNINIDKYGITIIFANTDEQLKALEILTTALGDNYIIALNLIPATPAFFKFFNAEPMKLGLDLRGGIHLLIEVNFPEAIVKREESYVEELRMYMREEKLRYAGINLQKEGSIIIRFRNPETRQSAISLLAKDYPEFSFESRDINNTYLLALDLSATAKQEIEKYAMEQSMTILRNKVNELGVAEAVVQRQGANRIVVQLPGVLDPARAKDILGKTARLEFKLVDDQKSSTNTLYNYNGNTVYLKNKSILNGEDIVGAQSGYDEYGRPEVQVRVGGSANQFAKITGDNIGKPLAVLYIETNLNESNVGGKTVNNIVRNEKIINVATIQAALGNRFRITGLDDANEARNLALLLRAGALPATVTIVEERTVGPSLGQENIEAGMWSVITGFLLVVLAMIVYYRWFGVLANIALFANLILLIAALSLVKATLTLPAIAAIVLTLGMAVDANVLIFERIREEVRKGIAPQSAIFTGFEKAFITIVDANITTFIAAIVLFTIGSGPIRGFAVTLIFGLITSVFTAVMVTRALVNAWYGKKNIQKLSIGI